MEAFESFISSINALVWGPPMLVMILGVGLFLSIGLKLMPVLKLRAGFQLMWKGRTGAESEGEIPPFQALMTALSATVGTGNIAGVATAIALGGPGAIFWMWVIAFLGSASAFVEATLGQLYKENKGGEYRGGPAYYIEKGLGIKWFATLFAIATSFPPKLELYATLQAIIISINVCSLYSKLYLQLLISKIKLAKSCFTIPPLTYLNV